MAFSRLSKRLFPMLLILALFSCKGQKSVSKNQNTEAENQLKKKYALIFGVPENEITNLALYKFVDEWYGVPYKAAGRTKEGVDCSGLVAALYYRVYKKDIGGTAASLFEACDVIQEKDLKEGDLVFFKINSDKISHVGVYLQNRHFVHASTHKGVIISSLDEDYYKKYFYKGGRIN